MPILRKKPVNRLFRMIEYNPKPPDIKNNVHVIYESNNWVGELSKYVLYEKFGPNAHYHPYTPGDHFNINNYTFTKEDNIIILGVYLNKETVEDIKDHVKNVIIITQYRTIWNEFDRANYIQFDPTKPVFIQAWREFHHTRPLPRVLSLMHDKVILNDNKKSQASEDYYLWYYIRYMNVNHPHIWKKLNTDDAFFEYAIKEGEKLYTYTHGLLNSLLIYPSSFWTIRALNTARVAMFSSPIMEEELLNALSRKHQYSEFDLDQWNIDYVCNYTLQPNGKLKITFKSHLLSGNYDVSEVATQLSGYGHRNLSYAFIDREDIDRVLYIFNSLEKI